MKKYLHPFSVREGKGENQTKFLNDFFSTNKLGQINLFNYLLIVN